MESSCGSFWVRAVPAPASAHEISASRFDRVRWPMMGAIDGFTTKRSYGTKNANYINWLPRRRPDGTICNDKIASLSSVKWGGHQPKKKTSMFSYRPPFLSHMIKNCSSHRDGSSVKKCFIFFVP
ncbi:hypothetical protein SRABI36_03066 [Pedobacter sp. Bi36]|nr:hypothetical protein SRABI36_03066 [Pedobacter sp. Bi36]CAH0270543.1 hypothetical protein SRABI126_03466 [Pedobacter sp. Bi126]